MQSKEQFTPPPEQEPQLQPSDYLLFRESLKQIYQLVRQGSKGEYFTQPAAHFRQASELQKSGQPVSEQAAKNYLVDLPEPYGTTELSEDQIEYLLAMFGADFARADMVSPNLLTGEGLPLPVGGACLIETFGLQLLSDCPLLKEDPAAKAEVTEYLIENAPYYSQITGSAMVGSKVGPQVLYLEVFPWYLRVMELGVVDALAKTEAAYQRILEAVQRRALLVNPESKVLGVQFSDLNLEESGALQAWLEEAFEQLPTRFSKLKYSYQPEQYLAAWVRYTYSGPQILETLKAVVQSQGKSLDEYQLHVRTKQVDHFFLPTLIFQDYFTQQEWDFLSQYPNVAAFALDYFQNQFSDQFPNGFVGFDDWMLGGDYIHMDPNVGFADKGQPQVWEDLTTLLESPFRLSAANLNEHLALLELVATEGLPEQQYARQLLKLEVGLNNIEANLTAKTENYDYLSQVLEFLVAPNSSLEPTQIYEELIVSTLRKLIKTKPVQAVIRQQKITDQVAEDWLLSPFTGELVECPELQTALGIAKESWSAQALKGIQHLQQTLIGKREEYQHTATRVSDEVNNRIKLIAEAPHYDVLPLANNLVVSHAIQFGFDPDMRAFVQDVAAIEASDLEESQKLELVSRAMIQIMPKVTEYLTYILAGGRYPELRFQQLYQVQYQEN